MKKLFIILGTILLTACSSNTDSKNKIINNVKTDTLSSIKNNKQVLTEDDIKIDSFLLKVIEKEFMTYRIKNNEESQVSIKDNYLSFDGKAFEAKLIVTQNKDSLIAINNIIENENCKNYDAYLLKQNNNGAWQNIFEELYPDLSLYSFYSFEDKIVGQFEGDEKTVFAGYKFHFDKADSLGIQFMFCNLNSVENTKKLNQNGKVIYKSF